MENLFGSPPIDSTQENITLAQIMSKLDKIELEMPSMGKINEVDHRIQGNLNRLDSSMNKFIKPWRPSSPMIRIRLGLIRLRILLNL